MDDGRLDTNYGKIEGYVKNGRLNEEFLTKCNPLHHGRVGYVCSEQCHTRQHILQLYQENVAIYAAELNGVQWRWDSLDKNIIDDEMAVYEKTFKEQLIGRRTTEEVHLALGVLEEKISDFFNVIYRMISSMANHQNLYSAVRMHLTEEANNFFYVFERAKHLTQELLYRAICVTNIDIVMAKKTQFHLKLRLLIPSTNAVKARVCPYVIKSLDTSKTVVPGADKLRVYDYGPITPDFENFYLKSATERYDLRMPGVAEVTEKDEMKGSGKRLKTIASEINSMCPLKRNVKYFVLTKPNNTLQADFSKIRLEDYSKDEQLLRIQTVRANEIPVLAPGKCVAAIKEGGNKIERTFSKKSGKSRQVKAAATASTEPKIEEEGNEKSSVSELLSYIVVTAEIQFPGVSSFQFYKKIKVPVAVVSNPSAQRQEGYGSAIWNLIVWLEEANKGNYQWDWPVPYKGAVQREVSDVDYRIDHKNFVETYLNGLITVLARVKLEEPQQPLRGKCTDKDKCVDSPISVETFSSDEEVSKNSDDLITTDPDSIMKSNLFSSTDVETLSSDKHLLNVPPHGTVPTDPYILMEPNYLLSNYSDKSCLSDKDVLNSPDSLLSSDSDSLVKHKQFLSSACVETSLSTEDLVNIPDRLLSVEPDELVELNSFLSSSYDKSFLPYGDALDVPVATLSTDPDIHMMPHHIISNAAVGTLSSNLHHLNVTDALLSTDSYSLMESNYFLPSAPVELLSEETCGDLANFYDEPIFIDTGHHMGNTLPNASNESLLSNKYQLKIPEGILSTDPKYSTEINHFPSNTGTKPIIRIPKNLNADQLDFLSTKLFNLSICNGFVTRASFLRTTVKDTEMSFFRWFFYTCQAIGQNFGIKKPKKSNWFGDPTKSVWHSNFVIGYIDESKADEKLKEFRREENQILLIRFSGSVTQSVVIHIMSGSNGPVQGPPDAVDLKHSLGTILRDTPFTTNYKIITWDDCQCQFVLRPISEFYLLVDQATNSSNKTQARKASNKRSGLPAPLKWTCRYPRSPIAYDQIKLIMLEANLHNLMGELKIDANQLCDLLAEVMQSSEESDRNEGPTTRKNLRKILSVSPELLRLLHCGADKSVRKQRPFRH